MWKILLFRPWWRRCHNMLRGSFHPLKAILITCTHSENMGDDNKRIFHWKQRDNFILYVNIRSYSIVIPSEKGLFNDIHLCVVSFSYFPLLFSILLSIEHKCVCIQRIRLTRAHYTTNSPNQRVALFIICVRERGRGGCTMNGHVVGLWWLFFFFFFLFCYLTIIN